MTVFSNISSSLTSVAVAVWEGRPLTEVECAQKKPLLAKRDFSCGGVSKPLSKSRTSHNCFLY